MNVTPEMLAAGSEAFWTRDPDKLQSTLAAIYEAMRELDPECVRMRRIARSIVEDVSCIDDPTRLSPRTVGSIVFDARALQGTADD